MNKDKKNENIVPNLRFKEFDGKSFYKKFAFTDIFRFSTGKNIKQSEASPKFKIPCVRYGELYHLYGEVITTIINRTNLDKSKLLFSHGDEILLPSAGEDPLDIGSASALTIKNVAIGRTINILRPIKYNFYSQIYISYYINEKLKMKISTLARGSSISNVYNSDLEKLEIILPELSEQEKIAQCIVSLDKLIELEIKALETFKKHKKGLLQQLFPQEGEKAPKLRFPRFKGIYREEKLGVLCDYRNGKGNERLVSKEGAYFLISLNSINIEGNLKEDMKRVTRIDNSLKKGDLVMVLSDVAHGDFLGLVAIIPDNDYVLNQRMARLRLKDENIIDVGYLRAFINNNQAYFKRNGQGSSQKNLSKSAVLDFPVLIPDIQEQKKIAKVFASIDEKISFQEEEIKVLKEHKKGLMQQLFPNINT